jgi:Ca2+-binding EF-hand superfamily protein
VALFHEWINPLQTVYEEMSYPRLGVGRIVLTMRRNSRLSSLHKTSMLAVVFNTPHEDLRRMRNLFQSLDTDHNGTLSKGEFVSAIIQMSQSSTPLSDLDALHIFEAVDVNRDQQVSFTEFLAATLDPREIDANQLNKAFALLDLEKKGYITGSLSTFFSPTPTPTPAFQINHFVAVSDLERVMDAKCKRKVTLSRGLRQVSSDGGESLKKQNSSEEKSEEPIAAVRRSQTFLSFFQT